MFNPICIVPDCIKPARRPYGAGLCDMHAARKRRHGSVHAHEGQLPVKTRTGCGYRLVYRPGHPLASTKGTAYEHRVVLFDSIGSSSHPCHWCGASLDWSIRRGPGALEVDHLNADGFDNRLENLVPSCRTCNTTRARQARVSKLRPLGFWSGYDAVPHRRPAIKPVVITDR